MKQYFITKLADLRAYYCTLRKHELTWVYVPISYDDIRIHYCYKCKVVHNVKLVTGYEYPSSIDTGISK